MGHDGGHSKGMPKSSSVSSSDEKLLILSSESKFCGSGSELGGDGNHILGRGSVGGLSKFIGGLGVGKKGDGDRMESRGGVVFGEESAGEGGEDVVDVLDKGVSILGWPFWREFLSTVQA